MLNLPNDDEDNMEYVEKIINSVGLEFDPNIEIVEFGEMVGATEAEKEENEQVPPELNSLEFFVQALSYFEGEACGKLSSDEQSPASLDVSSNSTIEINAIKTFYFKTIGKVNHKEKRQVLLSGHLAPYLRKCRTKSQ